MLSEEQDGVRLNINGNNLVVALPGSGKTHTVKFSLDYLFEIVPDARPLIVTFTNPATDEIRSRLKAILSKKQFAQCKVSTFDSLMVEVSKNFDTRPLLVGAQQRSYVYRAYSFVVDELGFATDEFGDVYMMVHQIGRGLSCNNDLAYRVYKKYLEIINEVPPSGLRDLNMVANAVINMLVEQKQCFTNYTHCIVDEFQDTDKMQVKWLIATAKQTGMKVTVVGDDDQSIYSWRGASGYPNMRLVEKELDAKLHILSVCHRCRPEIIEAAGKVIEFNQHRIPKEMKSGKQSGGVVQFLSYKNKTEEQEAVLQLCKSATSTTGILARQNQHLDEIESMLIRYEISYQRLGGKSFFEKFEVVALLHLLNALINPKASESLIHAIAYFGEGERFANEVGQLSKQYGVNKTYHHISSEWKFSTQDIVRMSTRWSSRVEPAEKQQMVGSLFDSIVKWAPSKKQGGISVTAVYAKTILTAIYNSKKPFRESVQQYTDKLTAIDSKKESEEQEKLVTLATLHGSKGLEFHTVMMISVNEGVLPTVEGNIDPKIREEERRIAFVGMTRAMERLFVSSSNKVSTFLTESFPEVYTPDGNWVKETCAEVVF